VHTRAGGERGVPGAEPVPRCEVDVSTTWVKTALFRTLVPARLVVPEGDSLHLGPATAAMPEPFIDAMRRFHDRLPRLDPRPPAPHDTELDDAELEDLEFDEDGSGTSMTDEDLFDDDEFGKTLGGDPWDER
jgi:hypothetical protein